MRRFLSENSLRELDVVELLFVLQGVSLFALSSEIDNVELVYKCSW